MTNAQINMRKNFYRRVRNLSDSDFAQVIRFVDTLEGCEPNEETIAAFREAENPENLTHYGSLKEMFDDIGINVKC